MRKNHFFQKLKFEIGSLDLYTIDVPFSTHCVELDRKSIHNLMGIVWKRSWGT